MHALIAASPPLDTNSLYCNLLQCTHFADTCLLAEQDDDIAGFVSGYRVPERSDTLFIWQVAVAQGARGQGLAGRMLRTLLKRPACQGVRRIETTITPDNGASWALFRSLATALGAPLDHHLVFESGREIDAGHASEHLIAIGPFGTGD